VNTFPAAPVSVTCITTEQVREVDRLMIEEYGISLLQMMENAGRNLATLVKSRHLGSDASGRHVTVLCGSGGNGGGGMLAARRLANWGAIVTIACTRTLDGLSGTPRAQAETLGALGIPLHTASEALPVACDVVIDAIIGYSLSGAPEGDAALLIEAGNATNTPVVSLDVPSGLDSTSGDTSGVVIRAESTLTLAMPKLGLAAENAREYVGELFVADIGVPPELYAAPSLGLKAQRMFSQSEILRVSA
jgi:NAD(P)H-hydrate epimerase